MPKEFDHRKELERVQQALRDDGYGTYLSRREVERALSISRGTVYELKQDGMLPAIKLRGHFRFLRQDVARFAVLGSVTPTRR